MSQILKTTLYWRYEVRSPEACTVTGSDGSLLCSVAPGTPSEFVGDGHPVSISSALARMLPVPGKIVQQNGGSSSLSATGEPVLPLQSAGLTVRHATWFENASLGNISVLPAPWKDEVMTCYLKTAVPVSISGVTWLYGEPAMMEGFTFVVALQQVDASTILANLAYSLKR